VWTFTLNEKRMNIRMKFSVENQLILGGLLYTKLAALMFVIFGMEPGIKFVFNVSLGLAGIIVGVVLKAVGLRRAA
jgi:hypothetical protein